MILLGIDIGIKNIACILSRGSSREYSDWSHDRKLRDIADRIARDLRGDQPDKIVVTGSLRNGLANELKSRDLSVVGITSRIAQEEAVKTLYPNYEKLNLLCLSAGGYSLLTKDGHKFAFYANNRCSSGTGEGIEMFCRELRVERLDEYDRKKIVNLTVEEACALAQTVTDADFRINARCSVLSKSERVHLGNRGIPTPQILKAFFEGIGRNIQDFLEQYKVNGPVFLVGGVASNPIIVNLIDPKVRIVPRKEFFEAEGAIRIAHTMLSSQNYLEVFGKTVVSNGQESFRSLLPLSNYGNQVRVIKCEVSSTAKVDEPKIVSFDAGSTGTKVAVMTARDREVIYSDYESTGGNPLGAVKCLIQKMPAECVANVNAIVATGSGRDTLVEVLQAVFPNLTDGIFVVNEVLAHAAAACAFDPGIREKTIIDIGGQDSKYCRVVDGNPVDQALNQACSAGTGSFLEELGKQFNVGIVELGRMALSADKPLDLGERCTVFFTDNARIAFSNGVSLENIFAGAYYSVAQNYASGLAAGREIGETVILQGTPALNEALGRALAARIGKETKIIIPPHPGIAGARGAALKVLDEFSERLKIGNVFNLALIDNARVISHEQVTCQNRQCGNLCHLDKTVVEVSGRAHIILTGGCEVYNRIASVHKLPKGAPNAFASRDQLVRGLIDNVFSITSRKEVIGIPNALAYVRLLPFFLTFFRKLGFKVKVLQPQLDLLNRGGSSEFCVPVKTILGLDFSGIDILFLPKIISLPIGPLDSDSPCCTCSFVQNIPDMLRSKIPGNVRVIDQVLDLKNSFDKTAFAIIGARLECHQEQVEEAWKYAQMGYTDYKEKLLNIGRGVINYAREHNLPVILILGRLYLIYGELNSGIPGEIQGAGALALPVDCYPSYYGFDYGARPYWGESELNLAAVANSRKRQDVYSLWITCFDCGPDSFNEHFLRALAAGRPYTVLMVDGHTGRARAGFKTRAEAFVMCCRSDLAKSSLTVNNLGLQDSSIITRIFSKISANLRDTKLFLLPMGDNRLLAAAMRACGVDAEPLPLVDSEIFSLGRRHCSGKECAPCTAVVGSVLQHLRQQGQQDSKCNIFLPTAEGPCRFGMYFPLVKLLLKREGYNDIGLCTLSAENGYSGKGLGFSKIERLKLWAAICITDLMKRMLYFIRPVEKCPGEATLIYEIFQTKIVTYLEKRCGSNTLMDVANVWGLPRLLSDVADVFEGIKIDQQKAAQIKDVALVGEIYVRNEDYLNGGIVAELEKRGLRVHLAPIGEWVDYVSLKEGFRDGLARSYVRKRLYSACASKLGWSAKEHSIDDVLQEGMSFIGQNIPNGEAILTIGTPLLQYREEEVIGAVSVAPVSCMPGRIAEYHLSMTGLPAIFVYVDGSSPLDLDALDGFAYQMHQD